MAPSKMSINKVAMLLTALLLLMPICAIPVEPSTDKPEEDWTGQSGLTARLEVFRHTTILPILDKDLDATANFIEELFSYSTIQKKADAKLMAWFRPVYCFDKIVNIPIEHTLECLINFKNFRVVSIVIQNGNQVDFLAGNFDLAALKELKFLDILEIINLTGLSEASWTEFFETIRATASLSILTLRGLKLVGLFPDNLLEMEDLSILHLSGNSFTTDLVSDTDKLHGFTME